MILRPIQTRSPEALRIPERALALLAPSTDRQHAALLLYGLAYGWLDAASVEAALDGKASQGELLQTMGVRLAERMERAAQRVVDGIVPEGQGFTLLEIGLPDDDRFYSPPDTPALRVELCCLYHEPIDLALLPQALGTAICVALQLVQTMFPVLVGDDIQDFIWFEQELADEARQLAQQVDLDALTVPELLSFVEAAPNTFGAISEQLHLGNDPEWLLGRLRELTAPPPPAKVAADRYLPVSPDAKAAMLLHWLEEWRGEAPSLAEHPLARWVERVATVVGRQVAEGRDERARLVQPEVGEFRMPDEGIVVTLGEEWDEQSVEYLFESVSQSEEAHLSLLPLDPLALSQTHATLMALAEGTALLECLTVLNR